jgi:NAD(P)-dependent dehydrogenase (short-subunit alcohol dehydrogenase family)
MTKVILITGQSTFHHIYAPDVIHILGANTGIGFELVKLLAEKNHIVYLGARNETAGKEAECV